MTEGFLGDKSSLAAGDCPAFPNLWQYASGACRFVDIHHHILYGLDDGPATREEMERMIAAAAKDGTGVIIATPHVFPGIRPFDRHAYENALQEANGLCRKLGLPLLILGGAEILFTQSTVRMLREGSIPTLNGTRHVLVEWADDVQEETIAGAVREMTNAGFVPVIAHAERLRCFWKKPEHLARLRLDCSIRLQINADTLLRRAWTPPKLMAGYLCRTGLADYAASDAHNESSRPTRMAAAYEKLRSRHGAGYADALFGQNQQELLAPQAHNDRTSR